VIIEELLQRRELLERRLGVVRRTLLGRYREREEIERAITGLELEERSLGNELQLLTRLEEQVLVTTGG